MIIFLGESASGKSTLAAEFVAKHPEYHPLITYTTRPKRANEEDGVDYHFVTVEEYNQLKEDGKFIDTATYNDWQYGLAKEDCQDDKAVLIATPSILRNPKLKDIDYVSIYIKVDRASRLVMSIWRGNGSDNDIDEACRRSISDCGMFAGIEYEVDHVIENYGFKLKVEELVNKVEELILNE